MTELEDNGEEVLLGLSEVLQITGLTKLVLHAWERRYGLVPAGRSATGRRSYTLAQVERLRLLKACSDAGHRISSLVDLSYDDLMRLEEYHRARLSLLPLLEAVQDLDGDRLQSDLHARAKAEGPHGFVRRTALPLMQEVGDLWAKGTVTVAAEHLATAQLKRVLGGMLDDCPAPPPKAYRLIATTLEGEQHEIGALVATLVARLSDWDALFLGPNLPNAEICSAVRRRDADLVCLSALFGKKRNLEQQLRDLRQDLPAKTEIWIGGPAYAAIGIPQGVRYFPHLDSYLEALAKHGTPEMRAL